MIIKLLFGAGVLLLIYRFVKMVQGKPQEERRAYYVTLLIGLAAAALVVMSLTGRVHWIAGLIGGAMPFVRQYLLAHVYRKLGDSGRQGNSQDDAGEQGKRSHRDDSAMSENQALSVLGLKPGASEDEIIQAHRQLMQKLHPDRGGNDYLASQLNNAKETLLRRRAS